MLEDDGNSPVRLSLTEKLAMGAMFIALVGLLLVFLVGINLPKPWPGIGALLLILVVFTALVLELWKTGQREKPPYRYFKNVGFWLFAASSAAAIGVVILIVLFEMILPIPTFLPSSILDNLFLIAMGMLLFMMLALTVWLGQLGVQALREFRHWLDTGKW